MRAVGRARVSYQQVAYRLAVNNLAERLPAGSYANGSEVRPAGHRPLEMHCSACMHAFRIVNPQPGSIPSSSKPTDPGAAVYVLPRVDFGVFTVGTLPRDPDTRREIERTAEQICQELAGKERRGALENRNLRGACASGRIAIRWTASPLYVREVPRPAIDGEEARLELCRRHVQAFGPTTPEAFAWWASVSRRDALRSFEKLADELREVDFCGRPAWVAANEEERLVNAQHARGVRLLMANELRLFGQDKTGLFIGPGLTQHTPVHDSYRPHGVVVDGRIVGAWGRKAATSASSSPSRLPPTPRKRSRPRRSRCRFRTRRCASRSPRTNDVRGAGGTVEVSGGTTRVELVHANYGIR